MDPGGVGEGKGKKKDRCNAPQVVGGQEAF